MGEPWKGIRPSRGTRSPALRHVARAAGAAASCLSHVLMNRPYPATRIPTKHTTLSQASSPLCSSLCVQEPRPALWRALLPRQAPSRVWRPGGSRGTHREGRQGAAARRQGNNLPVPASDRPARSAPQARGPQREAAVSPPNGPQASAGGWGFRDMRAELCLWRSGAGESRLPARSTGLSTPWACADRWRRQQVRCRPPPTAAASHVQGRRGNVKRHLGCRRA